MSEPEAYYQVTKKTRHILQNFSPLLWSKCNIFTLRGLLNSKLKHILETTFFFNNKLIKPLSVTNS